MKGLLYPHGIHRRQKQCGANFLVKGTMAIELKVYHAILTRPPHLHLCRKGDTQLSFKREGSAQTPHR